MKQTKDPVNQYLVDLNEKIGYGKIGLMNSGVWHEDPRRLLFTLSRYKFVAKMFEDFETVLEIGCGDGFCSRIVKQTVNNLTITDYDPFFIQKFEDIKDDKWPIMAKVHDILLGPLENKVDGIYSLDVFEHIEPKIENIYFSNVANSLNKNGSAIFGSPSLESQRFASHASIEGHVNCKTAKDLKNILLKFFENVFIFSMNDEVVHTGFSPMAHYNLALCVNPKINE